MIQPLENAFPLRRARYETAPVRGVAEFSKANATLLVWLVFLAFGGSLLVSHYSRIHYLPIVGLDDSLSFLFAMSLIGGGVALLYGFLLFFPGVIWSEFLIFDSYLKPRLCYDNGEEVEPCLLYITRHLGVPFTIFMVAAHWALTSTLILIQGAGCVVGLTAASLYLWWSLRHISRPIAPLSADAGEVSSPTPHALLAKYLATFAVSAIISLASLLVIAQIIDPSRHSVSMLALCTVIVILANVFVAAQFRKRPSWAVVTSLLAAVILLAAGELQQTDVTMSERVLSAFGVEGAETSGVDGKDTVTVFIKAKNADLVSRLGAAGITTQADAVGGRIENVHILSRLGSEYFLRVNRLRFTLPKEVVLSWMREEHPKAPAPPSQR
jgi:heme/copper-type cytochrome/quinol oxidase subunit 4